MDECAFVLRTESWQFYSTVDVPNDPCASKKSVVHVYILRGSCSEVWKRLATRRQASIRSRFNVGIYSSLSFSLSFFSVRDASVPWLQFFPPFDFCLNRDATSKVAFRILYRDAARKNGKRTDTVRMPVGFEATHGGRGSGKARLSGWKIGDGREGRERRRASFRINIFVHATNMRRGRGTMRVYACVACSVRSVIASDHVQRARSNPWHGVWVERRFWQSPLPSDYW